MVCFQKGVVFVFVDSTSFFQGTPYVPKKMDHTSAGKLGNKEKNKNHKPDKYDKKVETKALYTTRTYKCDRQA